MVVPIPRKVLSMWTDCQLKQEPVLTCPSVNNSSIISHQFAKIVTLLGMTTTFQMRMSTTMNTVQTTSKEKAIRLPTGYVPTEAMKDVTPLIWTKAHWTSLTFAQ